MTRKHTPGPWLVDDRTVYALNENGFNRFFASVQDAHTDPIELEANAQLIAAAPDLLEALELLMRWQVKNVNCWSNTAYDDAARVIKRATGEEPTP